MNEEQAIQTVVYHLQEESGLLLKIGLNKGIDEGAFDELVSAMKFLSDHLKSKNSIPKKLASCFIDLTPYFFRAMDRYNEKEKERIEDMRDEIVMLANDICSPREAS